MENQNTNNRFKYLVIITVLWLLLLPLFWLLFWKFLPVDRTPWWITISDYVGIIAGMITATFAIATAVVMFCRHDELLRFLKRLNRAIGKTEFINTGDDFRSDKVKAVVIPVSRYEQPAWIINHLQPEKVALICTEHSRSSALKLINDYGEPLFINSFGAIQNNEPWSLLQAPEDPSESRKMTRRFIRDFREMGYLPSEIFVDTTGGTVPMSIGCFQGAEEEGISSIYIGGTVKIGGNMIVEDPRKKSDGRAVFINDRSKTLAEN